MKSKLFLCVSFVISILIVTHRKSEYGRLFLNTRYFSNNFCLLICFFYNDNSALLKRIV